MKKLFKLCLAACAMLLTALPSQAQYVSNNKGGGYTTAEEKSRYVDGEVIVKFKDSERVSVRRNAKGKIVSTSSDKLNEKLQPLGFVEMKQVMPLTGGKVVKGMRKVPSSGRMIQDSDLSQLYVIRYDKSRASVKQVIEQLTTLDDVELAEPNYIIKACAQDDNSSAYNDPLFAQQWGVPAVNLQKLWGVSKTDNRRPVIAILDTGVDIGHPDLKDNIWTNELEADGAILEDDDHNGYEDDVHGWDFIAEVPITSDTDKKLGKDRNGHGTHCAGIAAAVGNNGIGIVGANPDALIMPVKILGDDGMGSMLAMLNGIDYAIANGANILSMSLGMPESSVILYSALAKAYQHNVLPVAAAGNDGNDIYFMGGQSSGLSFPAAYDIVLGVMASDSHGNLASYSNYDSDGPYYSEYVLSKKDYGAAPFFNYDVLAPGTDITSTFPGGGYKSLSGTSMATPLVAGILSRVVQTKGYSFLQDDSWIGDFQTCFANGNKVIDAFDVSAYNDDNRGSVLYFKSIEMDDATEGNGNGRIDVGETISFYPTIKCTWGTVRDYHIHAEFLNDVPSEYAEIIQNDVTPGYSVSAGGELSLPKPIMIRVKEGCPDNLNLSLKFIAQGGSLTANAVQQMKYNASSYEVLPTVISKDMVFSPNKRYRLDEPLGIPSGCKLTILPGTTIEIGNNAYIQCEGELICNGTPENPIVFKNAEYSSPTMYGGSKSIFIMDNVKKTELSYVIFDGLHASSRLVSGSWDNVVEMKNCQVVNCEFRTLQATLINCNVYNNFITTRPLYGSIFVMKNSNFINNEGGGSYEVGGCQVDNSNIYNNYFGGDLEHHYIWGSEIVPPTVLPSVYWGSAVEKNILVGMSFGNKFASVDLQNMLTRPSSEAHGVVWKVVVDGNDLDTADLNDIPALGVGQHTLEVYFNRPMDKSVNPTITYGLREPYNQNVVEGGNWNDAGDIFVTTLEVTGKTTSDGLNRLCIAGARDMEFFEIPVEQDRFSVMIQKVGSLNTNLIAEAGIGSVKLAWETDEADFADLMGYNLYRYVETEEKYEEWGYNEERDEWGYWEKTLIVCDTIKVNDMLIDPSETTLTDYNVEPGTTYYYYIMEMGTDLQQHDVSKVVAATPLTATKGDANGSMNVDIADVVTEVNYLTGQNPQPFIFEAADVNSDETVNILDVVGTVNIIITPKGAATASTDAKATYTVENGILYVDSDTPLGGVQVSIKANANTVFEALEGLDGMEQAGVWVAEDEYMLLAYSMSGRVIGSGKQPLMRIGDAEVTDVVASDAKGHNVLAINGTATSIANLPFGIENYEGAEVRYYDLAGRRVSAEAARKSGVAIQSLFIGGKCVKSYKILNR